MDRAVSRQRISLGRRISVACDPRVFSASTTSSAWVVARRAWARCASSGGLQVRNMLQSAHLMMQQHLDTRRKHGNTPGNAWCGTGNCRPRS